MPKVGKRHFSYSKKGQAAAKSYARKTGQKVTKKKKGGYQYGWQNTKETNSRTEESLEGP